MMSAIAPGSRDLFETARQSRKGLAIADRGEPVCACAGESAIVGFAGMERRFLIAWAAPAICPAGRPKFERATDSAYPGAPSRNRATAASFRNAFVSSAVGNCGLSLAASTMQRKPSVSPGPGRN